MRRHFDTAGTNADMPIDQTPVASQIVHVRSSESLARDAVTCRPVAHYLLFDVHPIPRLHRFFGIDNRPDLFIVIF